MVKAADQNAMHRLAVKCANTHTDSSPNIVSRAHSCTDACNSCALGATDGRTYCSTKCVTNI